MKRILGLPLVDPGLLNGFVNENSELDKQMASIPISDRATRLTLEMLSDELLYSEGLLEEDEDMDLFIIDDSFDDE